MHARHRDEGGFVHPALSVSVVVVYYVIQQMGVHFWNNLLVKDPRIVLPSLVCLTHDTFLLITVGAISKLLLGKLKQHSFLIRLIVALPIFLTGFILSIYPLSLQQFLTFPLNIFRIDFEVASNTLTNYLGVTSLVPGMFFLLGATLIVYKSPNIYIGSAAFKTLVGSIFTVLVFLSSQKSIPHPFTYSVKQEILSLFDGRKAVVPALIHQLVNDNSSITCLPKLEEEVALSKNILVFVMESVESQQYEEWVNSDTSNFFLRNAHNVHYYSRYYTSNMDSYTSLIALTTAVQVPYRAYANIDLYDSVNQSRNIVQEFKELGFRTLFLSTYNFQPFVPVRNAWERVIESGEIENKSDFVTLGSSKMEEATEDRVAINTIVEFLSKDSAAFVMQELVYGHSPEWQAHFGMTALEYYSKYFSLLQSKLDSIGKWENTTIVIVSDHGTRAESGNLENYRVPLIFINNSLTHCNIKTQYNHLDFAQLLFSYTMKGATQPVQRDTLLLVGSTEKWRYGVMIDSSNYCVIDDTRQIIEGNKGEITPSQTYSIFQNYLNQFYSKFSSK